MSLLNKTSGSCGDQFWQNANTFTINNSFSNIVVGTSSTDITSNWNFPAISGSYITTDSNGLLTWDSYHDTTSDLGEFFELVLMALGHDIKYSDFQNMTSDQRKSLLRDIKLSRLLKSS